MTTHESDKLNTAFEQWQHAEAKFAAALKEFVQSGQPTKITRKTALELGELRGAADSKMGIYLKKAVES